MKEILKTLAILFSLALCLMPGSSGLAAGEPANRPIRDKWALVVGISDFGDPRLKLNYSAKDAQDFAQYLRIEAGFASDHVKVLLDKDATQRRILSELCDKWLPRVANPDDLVVLFISTHGSGAEMDVGGQNYLVASDTDVNNLYTTGIPMQKLARDIKERVHCDRVVIFLDACHSGATEIGAKGLVRTGVDASEFAAGSGQLVIASSKDDQVSWESKKQSNGVFTASLLDALRSKGGVTIGQTFAALKDRVQDTVLRERGVLQTPVMSSQWQGNDILISAEPVDRHPGLEDEVSSASTIAEATPSTSTADLSSHSAADLSLHMAADLSPHTMLKAHPQPATIAAVQPSRVPLSTTPTPVSPRSLIVAGLSVGRIKIGMSKGEALQMLGKPTSVNADTCTYWSSDRRFFLSFRLVGDAISEIAFSSPIFKMENGICVANYSSDGDQFKPAVKNSTMNVHTLRSGGFSVIMPIGENGAPVGVVHKSEFDSLSWIPRGLVNSPPESVKPSLTASGGNATLPMTAPVSNTLVVPGLSLAKAKLGMSKDEVVGLLGKPEEESDHVFTYWYSSGTNRYFLSLRFANGVVSDVAYSSPAFATAAGINVSNFNNYPDQFAATKKDASGSAEIFTVKGGGLSMVIRDATTGAFGWLHSVSSRSSSISWVPSAK